MSGSGNSSVNGAESDGDVDIESAFRPFFWFFAATAVLLFYYAMGYARKYCNTAAFLLPPFICACIAFDNVVMATTGIARDKPVVQAMLAFHSCVIPMILLVCYEIAYLVHKQKSVNFCGISFESGHRRMLGRNALSTCLRFAVWLIGGALLAMNLLACYRWQDETPDVHSIYDLEGDSTTHAVFAVAPALVLVAMSLYIGLQLWNYGTFYSYMVHATCFNPWIWMLVGSVSLLAGYLMPTPIYAISSNGGELVMIATIIRMFREVHHDIQQGQQMRNFIDPIATVSPQSQSRSGLLLSQGGGADGGVGGAGGGGGRKYSPMGGVGPSGSGSGLTATYLEVLTPREAEQLQFTADGAVAPAETTHNHHHHHRHFPHLHRLGASGVTTLSSSSASSTTALSVVVSSTRTNPLFD